MVKTVIDEARWACEAALSEPDLARARAALAAAGATTAEIHAGVRAVTSAPASLGLVRGLAARATDPGDASEGAASLERTLLLTTAIDALSLLPASPVCDEVKVLFCEEVRSWTGLDASAGAAFRLGSGRFEAACKTASLRRFPAGQFDWEIGGLPLSYLLRVTPRSLPRALYVTAARFKGRAPIFFAHLGYRRQGASLSEVEANKSYYRMAKSLERQPAVKGLVASSWLRSPDTPKVSPHLAWLNRVFLENGGFVAVMGPADPGSGVLVRSPTRRRLYEIGEFKPTTGLVLWPREAMIGWAERHPELADPPGP